MHFLARLAAPTALSSICVVLNSWQIGVQHVVTILQSQQGMQADAGTCATATKSPKLEPNWPWSHQADGSRDGSRGASGSSKWSWLCHYFARNNNFGSSKIRLKQNRDKSLVNMPEKYTGHFGPAKNASVWAGGDFNQHTAIMPRDLETTSCSKLHFPVSNLSTWQLRVFHWLTLWTSNKSKYIYIYDI